MRFSIAIALCIIGAVSAARLPSPKRLETILNRNFDEYNKFVKTLPKAVEEDANLKVPELIVKYGYPMENHYVTSSDGYILNVHRIPYGKSGPTENRPAVFVMHGLLCSSADWVIAGPEFGLAYLLADAGYDVWMGNARGNTYSRNHTSMDPDSDAKHFWDFSWNEIGMYDLPAMIDYTIANSEQEKVFYIGHSQGTTSFYVMASEWPQYNDKIRAQFSLAPIAYMDHMTSPMFQFMAWFEGPIEWLLDLIGMYEFLPSDGFIAQIAQDVCDEGIFQPLCTNLLFLMCGFNKAQMNTTLLPIIMGHTPAGSSTNQFLHYAQEIRSGKFRKWDYGTFGNLDEYDSSSPPNYDLGKISAPVYLFYSHNDWLAAETDVLKLWDKLPNPQGKFLISDDNWNHLDYLWAIDANAFVYSKVISLMTRH